MPVFSLCIDEAYCMHAYKYWVGGIIYMRVNDLATKNFSIPSRLYVIVIQGRAELRERQERE